jgi:hypothetical protein
MYSENGKLRRLTDEQLRMIRDSSDASVEAKMAVNSVLASRKALRILANSPKVHPSVRKYARERLAE